MTIVPGFQKGQRWQFDSRNAIRTIHLQNFDEDRTTGDRIAHSRLRPASAPAAPGAAAH